MTGRLFADGEVPISGEVQFWRMHPDTWARALLDVRALGIRTVATYLSWRRHVPTRGTADLRGRHGAELDVHRFLSLCRDAGLRVVLKPGPWICAEEVNGGLPDCLVEQQDLLARDHLGQVVMGYNPPFKHPMPSYASVAYRRQVEEWIRFVWSDLAEFVGEDGPVVATQFDNEPSLGFQDSMFGFDHHPEALASWHEYVGGVVAPPSPVGAGGPVGRAEPSEVERQWIDWQRRYICDYLAWLRDLNVSAGAPTLVGTVNLNTHPVRGVPQSGRAIAAALPAAVVGEDHYFVPPLDARDLAGLALAAAQATLTATPLVWAPEMQAGIWRSPGEPVDYPDPTVEELAGWWGAALALGYQGFNLYMLVNRENWEHAPLGPGGAPVLADAVRDLVATVRAVPDLAAYRPVAETALAWSDVVLEGAYRGGGTQASPRTPWEDPVARDAYLAIEERAVAAIELGVQFALDPALSALEPAQASLIPLVSAPPGVLARVHRHPDGREVLYVVPWARGQRLEDVTLRFRDASAVRTLTDVRDQQERAVTEAGEVILPSLRPGLNLYHLSDA